MDKIDDLFKKAIEYNFATVAHAGEEGPPEYMWEALKNIGFDCHVEEAYRLPSLTTVRLPDGMDEASVRKQLLNDYNIEVGGGLGELKGKVWRIGLMGYTSRKENVNALVSALRNIMA